MFKWISLVAFGVLAGLTQPAFANGLQGTWLTEADGKGQVALVTAEPCGAAFCGTITQVIDANGNRIEHKNVGRRIFWDMKQVSPGVYKGRAYVPAFGAEYNAEVTLSGNSMKVGGCLGPICKSQTWTRTK